MPGRSFAVPTRGTMRGMQQQCVKACEIMHGITYWCIYSLDENTPIDCSFSFPSSSTKRSPGVNWSCLEHCSSMNAVVPI